MPMNITDYAPPDHKSVDPKIAHPLGRLRGIIRRYVSIEGVLAVLLFLAVWFWLAMLLDFGVFKLFSFDWALEAHVGFRVVALVLAIAALLALVATKMVIRLTRDFSDASLALILEKRYPHILGDRLISAVQLADLEWSKKYGYSTAMIQKTIDDVREKIDQVPVQNVFNWRRLWIQGGAFVAITLGFFLLSGVAVCAITKTPPGKFIPAFREVSTILVERDVLLANTPWPRRAYLEVVNFPGDEMRIGRDVPSPRLRVAAYKWVIADSKAQVGWRPMTWADLDKVGVTASKLPLQPVRDARFSVDYGPFLYGAAHPFTAPTLPTDVATVPDDPAQWPVDRVEQVFVNSPDVTEILAAKFQSELDGIAGTMQKLEERAADSSMSRTIRKLQIPDDVELSYWGAKTRVTMSLRKEGQNNEFTGTLSDLKETVKFHARGENYYTPTKQITLVPPPMLQELKRDEYHPAYLYHKAPFTESKDLPDELKAYTTDPRKLKGRKHVLKDQAVSLTGDRSRFDIPMGTEFVLYGRSDKELKEALILPKAGKFPGIEAEVTDPEPIPLPITDGHNISIEFTAAAKRFVNRQTDFDIFLRDTDGVTSKRAVQIVVEEDRPPEVDVVVDVIRKVGGVYMCTPQALIPFTKESKIRDDKGLNRVEYVFSYSEIEPLAVTAKRAEYASWFFNGVPVLPSLGDPLGRIASMIENMPRVRPALAMVNDRVPVPQFAAEYTNRGRQVSLEDLDKRLNGPRPLGPDRTVVDLVVFPPDAVREEVGFDLKKVAAGLKKTGENEAQRIYVLTLNVIAVDTNVEADSPGIAQNKESLVFKLVSDGELLTEISREESGLADKLDDAIRRLADMDNKLRSMVARIPTLNQPDQFLPEQTRANELSELLTKAKDVTAEVATDYSRILLEFKANRLPENLIKDIETKVVGRLQSVLATDSAVSFPKAEETYGKFSGEIMANRQPAPEVGFEMQSRLTALLTILRDIRSGIGQGLDLKKIISQVEDLINQEVNAKKVLEVIQAKQEGKIKEITIVPPPAPVSVTAGQKVTVRVPAEIGPLYEGKFTLTLEPSPGSELKVGSTITMKEDDKDFVLEITAGFAKGMFWVRVTPDVGPAKDVRVIVK